MKCPFCKSLESSVVDSRLIDDGDATRRRRKCGVCNARFTTYERYHATPLMVIKKNNRRESFDIEKVRAGISHACNKRNIPAEIVERIVDDIEREIRDIPNSEIKAEYIGELILERLREVDEVAYMRFASVYKGFEDVSAFVQEAFALEASLAPVQKIVSNGDVVTGKDLITTLNKM